MNLPELPIIALAYAASALVALLAVAGFSRPIDRIMFRLISDDLATAWTSFVKFALFCVAFTAGMPPSEQGKFIGFEQPVIFPPIPGDGTMFVMRSVGGALLAAAYYLLVFFGATLAVYSARRFAEAMRARRASAEKSAAEKKVEDDRLVLSREAQRRREPVKS